MSDDTLFARCAVLRRELADLVETLTEEQLRTPSACGAWDVRTVAAHLTVLPTVSRLRFGLTVLRHRGDMDRTIDTLSREAARHTAAAIAATLRAAAESRAVPPTMDARAPFTDLLVHTADVRLPLGLAWEPDAGDLSIALDFLARGPIGFPSRGRLDGVRLVATDFGRGWGEGAEVTGPAAGLVLAACGRPGALEGLDGPGVAVLAAWGK